ncbi:hypothetical protein TIFTF001_042791 [Ficus carica]|uniref:Cytosolic endo-beta-N-acetylglucosaminidase C-terminal domain-containing protein n=1 Tax=Ficus carica TaxID=3494 RepID=A0AA87YVX1_FICCA|nr:hypothetical protein TIFTF001_042791 [Ficus carica]
MLVKSDNNSLLGMYLEFSSPVDERKSILLAPREANHFANTFSEVAITRQLKHLKASQGWVIQETRVHIRGHKLTEIGSVCYWSQPRMGKSTSTSSSKKYYAVLGHISIKTSGQTQQFPPSDSWQVEGHDIKWDAGSEGSKTASVKITWKLKEGNDSEFPKYNIYAEKIPVKVVPGQEAAREFLGVVRAEAFYVAGFAVASDIGIDGSVQKLDDSPFYQLEAPEAP